jgi:hypothetical protein
METKIYQLGNTEKNRLINIMKLLFGFACIGVAAYWLIFRINSADKLGTIWITIIFLTGFGFYEIWSGLGKADRYIEIGKNFIKLKRYIFMAPVKIDAALIDKIELFSLKMIFYLKAGKKIVLRFGTTFNDINVKITDEIAVFAEANKIPVEVTREEI